MEKSLGKHIAQNRKALGLTQDQLAEKLGVTAQAVSKWENDQSCPDIALIPTLAQIFGITIDELLGNTAPAVRAEVVDNEKKDGKGWEFHWDAGRNSSLSFAVSVLGVGVVYLLNNLFTLGASFWDVLWPTFILVFGLFGLFPRFSFLRTGCVLLGGYCLANNLSLLPAPLSGNILFPALVILFGLSLLGDALRKPKKPKFSFRKKGKEFSEDLEYREHGFNYSASFGEATQYIDLDQLDRADISVSFGEFTVDFSNVLSVGDNCQVEANCSFGELTLLVPSCYLVRPVTSTAFAGSSISGKPDAEPRGIIHLESNASFGQINLKYI